MKRFREHLQPLPFLPPPSVDEFIGENDLVRVSDRIIEGLDQRVILKGFQGGGAPAYHPTMMLKVLIYAYSTRIYLSRQIAKALTRDVGFMWLSGMQRPDFHTMNRFRSEYFADILEQVFAEIVQILLAQGYIESKDCFVDGTKIEADAGKYTYVWSKSVKRYSSESSQDF